MLNYPINHFQESMLTSNRVTGGSGGMGFATAALLLSQGAKVSIADVSEKALQEAATKLNEIKTKNQSEGSSGDFMTAQVDVRKVDQVDDWIGRTVEKFGKLDGGVNLAGVIPKGINIDRLRRYAGRGLAVCYGR